MTILVSTFVHKCPYWHKHSYNHLGHSTFGYIPFQHNSKNHHQTIKINTNMNFICNISKKYIPPKIFFFNLPLVHLGSNYHYVNPRNQFWQYVNRDHIL